MSQFNNNIEFIFNKDSQGNDIDLEDMPLDVAISIRDVLNSLLDIAIHEGSLNLNVGIRRGSAAPRLVSETPSQMRIVYNKIKDAAESSPERDNVYVKNLNVIYNRFRQFSEFDIIYKNEGTNENITTLFSNKFKEKRSREQITSPLSIKFIEGVIKDSGGDNPNFHIETQSGQHVKINCNEEQAKEMARMLYSRICISTWSKAKKDGKFDYSFCDKYIGSSEKYFYNFQPYYDTLISSSEVDSFKVIKDILESYYNERNYYAAKKFIRLFLNENSTPTHLRTILIISKAFKYDEILRNILEKIEELLASKIGQVY